MASTIEVAKKLVELCKANKGLEAVETLYGDDVVNIEAIAMPGTKQRTEGKAAVKAKNQWWMENHEIHSMTVEGPWPFEDRFIVNFAIDVTPKAGPMAGKRMQMSEAGHYTVKDGKIVKEEFFYGGM